MMRIFFLAILLSSGGLRGVQAQTTNFPNDWLGHWKGELFWYRAGSTEPRKVEMSLEILPADSAGTYSWDLAYGPAREDNRPYLLIARDTASGHWVIDERNGIVLDYYRVGTVFTGVFTVMGNTIQSVFRLENKDLHVEFISTGAESIAQTGKGNEESPRVLTYKVGSYQRAVLHRIR